VTAIRKCKDDLSVEGPVVCYFNIRVTRGISQGIVFGEMLIQRCGGRDIVVFERCRDLCKALVRMVNDVPWDDITYNKYT